MSDTKKFREIQLYTNKSWPLQYHMSISIALFAAAGLHPVYFKWDRLCGAISKFRAVHWDTWYQFYEICGTQGTHEYQIQLDYYIEDMFVKSYEFDGINIVSV